MLITKNCKLARRGLGMLVTKVIAAHGHILYYKIMNFASERGWR